MAARTDLLVSQVRLCVDIEVEDLDSVVEEEKWPFQQKWSPLEMVGWKPEVCPSLVPLRMNVRRTTGRETPA